MAVKAEAFHLKLGPPTIYLVFRVKRHGQECKKNSNPVETCQRTNTALNFNISTRVLIIWKNSENIKTQMNMLVEENQNILVSKKKRTMTLRHSNCQVNNVLLEKIV